MTKIGKYKHFSTIVLGLGRQNSYQTLVKICFHFCFFDSRSFRRKRVDPDTVKLNCTSRTLGFSLQEFEIGSVFFGQRSRRASQSSSSSNWTKYLILWLVLAKYDHPFHRRCWKGWNYHGNVCVSDKMAMKVSFT